MCSPYLYLATCAIANKYLAGYAGAGVVLSFVTAKAARKECMKGDKSYLVKYLVISITKTSVETIFRTLISKYFMPIAYPIALLIVHLIIKL